MGKYQIKRYAALVSFAIKMQILSVDVIDFDKDGDLDICVGNRIYTQQIPSTQFFNTLRKYEMEH